MQRLTCYTRVQSLVRVRSCDEDSPVVLRAQFNKTKFSNLFHRCIWERPNEWCSAYISTQSMTYISRFFERKTNPVAFSPVFLVTTRMVVQGQLVELSSPPFCFSDLYDVFL